MHRWDLTVSNKVNLEPEALVYIWLCCNTIVLHCRTDPPFPYGASPGW
ncbi:hypothetical protein EE612_058453 [Oryza sativa]|nr:hypothetical protein EE612_058453 [Oryza sativa]